MRDTEGAKAPACRSATLRIAAGPYPDAARTARVQLALDPHPAHRRTQGRAPARPGDVAPRSDMRINRRPIRERAVTPGVPRDGLDRRAHRPGSCSREARETQLPHGRAHLLRGRARARRARIPRRPLHAIGRPLAEGTSRARARSHRAMRVVCASTTARMHEAHGCADAHPHRRARRGLVRIDASRARWADARSRSRHTHATAPGRAALGRPNPPYTRPAERMRAHGGSDLMRVRRRSREAGDGLRP